MSVSSVLSTVGRTTADLAYRCSPIFLTGGIATDVLGGVLPIITFTESVNLANSLISGSTSTLDTDNFFAHFSTLPGGTLINNNVGQYPFANQTVAANAIIANPLNVSMFMECAPRVAGAYVTKLATISALQAALYQHNSQGGTYTVLTPGFLYTNLIMTGFRDVTENPMMTPQSAFVMDFQRPLTQLTEAEQAQSTLMSKLTNGSSTGTSWATTGTGNPFSSLVGSIF